MLKETYDSTQKWISENLKGDKVIWGICFSLLAFSIPIVYSASVKDAYALKNGNTEQYLFKHVAFCALALLVMFGIHRIPYTKMIPFSRLGVWISIPFLLFTTFRGESVNEASRWIMIPIINYKLQPSEIAKLLLIAHLSLVLARNLKGKWDTRKLLSEPILMIGSICALIMLDNISTAAILFAVCLLLMFVGNVPVKYLVATVLVCAALGAVAVSTKTSKRSGTGASRMKMFFNKDTVAYQSAQSYMAMARGGIKGEGTSKSRQRRFLPEPQKDFIYAITVEEYGTIGGVALIGAYLLLLYRGLRAISIPKRPFGGILSAGLTFSIVFQAFTTMAVTVGLFPVTGQALPFFSQGGTSMVITAVAMGMILSVSRGEFDEKQV